jgi:hypothetical protein
LRRVAGFPLAARENAVHPSGPRAGCHRVHARSAALVERPIGYRDARIDRDIRMGDEENPRHRSLPLPLVALWKYVTAGVVIEGVTMKAA